MLILDLLLLLFGVTLLLIGAFLLLLLLNVGAALNLLSLVLHLRGVTALLLDALFGGLPVLLLLNCRTSLCSPVRFGGSSEIFNVFLMSECVTRKPAP